MRIHIHPMFRSISLSTPTVLTIAAMLCIGIGTFGLSYVWHFDHRTADSLCAYCRCTHGVGNGVERKDGGNGAVDVGLVFFQYAGNTMSFLFLLCGKGDSGAQ